MARSCFVICPIGEEGSPTRERSDKVLRHVIRPSVHKMGYEAERADHIDRPGLITSQIIQRVVEDDLVVADLTERNPNVYYELAIRHAIRKPLIQIIAADETLPFDVANTRTIRVDHRDMDSVENAKQEIERQIGSLEAGPQEIETPISLSLDLQRLRSSTNPEERGLAEVVEGISELRTMVAGLSAQARRSLGVTFAEHTGAEGRHPFRPALPESMLFEAVDMARGSQDAGQKALAYGVIASALRDSLPWLHVSGMEIVRQYSAALRSAPQAEARFLRMADQTLRSPWIDTFLRAARVPPYLPEALQRLVRS